MPIRTLRRPTALSITALLPLLVSICGCDQPSAAPPRAAAGTPATPAADQTRQESLTVDLQILDYEGIQRLIAGHRGKVVVLDAWATSCAPCIKEFPNLVTLHKKYGPEKVACVSLSFDYEGIGRPEDVREPVLKFLRKQQAAFDNILSSEESDVLYKKFQLASVPAVFVFDREGKLRQKFAGEASADTPGGSIYDRVGSLVAELLAASK